MLPSIHELKGHSPSAAYQAVRSRLELLKLLDNRPGERAKGVSVCSDGQTLDAVVLTREDGSSTAVQRVNRGGMSRWIWAEVPSGEGRASALSMAEGSDYSNEWEKIALRGYPSGYFEVVYAGLEQTANLRDQAAAILAFAKAQRS